MVARALAFWKAGGLEKSEVCRVFACTEEGFDIISRNANGDDINYDFCLNPDGSLDLDLMIKKDKRDLSNTGANAASGSSASAAAVVAAGSADDPPKRLLQGLEVGLKHWKPRLRVDSAVCLLKKIDEPHIKDTIEELKNGKQGTEWTALFAQAEEILAQRAVKGHGKGSRTRKGPENHGWWHTADRAQWSSHGGSSASASAWSGWQNPSQWSWQQSDQQSFQGWQQRESETERRHSSRERSPHGRVKGGNKGTNEGGSLSLIHI